MSKNVLLVDDALMLRMIQHDLLEKNGYNVVGQAENGTMAIKKFKSLAPDIVIMDLAMPLMDGITALKQIKKINERALVVVCSSLGQPHLIADSLLAGASDYIVKPFSNERFLNAINNSFTIKRKFNIGFLKHISDKCNGLHSIVLSQEKIDEILDYAGSVVSDVSSLGVDEFLLKIGVDLHQKRKQVTKNVEKADILKIRKNELIHNWNRLTEEQQIAILNLIKTI